MIQIRSVSDLKNKLPEIEKAVGGGDSVYMTQNEYGSMAVLSLEAYSRLTDGLETALDEADRAAAENERRCTHEEVFENLKEQALAKLMLDLKGAEERADREGWIEADDLERELGV